MKRQKARFGTASAVAAAFFAALILKLFLIDVMIAEGRSMLPTIQPGTIIVVNRVAYGLRKPLAPGYIFRWSQPKSGDIVVFPAPDGLFAVKRIQEAGDDGRFMAIGDNRDESLDSRQYGPVVIDNIIGKVVGIE